MAFQAGSIYTNEKKTGSRREGRNTTIWTPCLPCIVYHVFIFNFIFLNHVFSPIFSPDHHLKISIDLPRDAISAGMLC
jgi:hypothetical protein